MKYTREFKFFPNMRCYDYQAWGHKTDCYPLPSFNYIANFLEEKGWEIIDYKEIPSGLHDTHGIPDNVKFWLLIHAISCDKPKEDEKYNYIVNKNGGLE